MGFAMPAWVAEFPGAVTVTSADGTILYLNDRASAVFAKSGGREALVGERLEDCHQEASRGKIAALREANAGPMKAGVGAVTNAYTVTKGGIHKFIYQAPWYEEGHFAGLVELSMEIPAELPHFERG